MQLEYNRFCGVKLTYDDKSITLRSSFLGKPGVVLQDKQIIALARRLANFDSSLASIEGSHLPTDLLPFKRAKLTNVEAPRLPDETAYKFTDDRGLDFWLHGSIRLNPPATYLTIENPNARDLREGLGLLYLQGQKCFSALTSMSGFNSLVICTSADARKSQRRRRMEKFGERIVKIRNVPEFARRVAKLCDATSFVIRDVTYSDAKAVRAFSEFSDHFSRFSGELNEASLEYIAINWLDDLIQKTAAASIFTKPLSFAIERERRFQFTFPANVTEPIVVEDASLCELIELVQ